jgi:hypothetical protein
LPHSEIPGSTIARISPGLIAACYVLHRLSVPRHPPDALHYALEHHTQRQRPDCIAAACLVADAANSLEDTCRTRASRLSSGPSGPRQVCRTCPPRSRHILASSPSQSAKRNESVITFAAERNFMPSCDGRRPRPPTRDGGGERDRTDDLLLAKQALSQLSYTPGSGRALLSSNGGPGRI